MKTCIRLLSLILTLPVFSQTDGDDIVIGLSQFAECHAAYGRFEKDIFSIGIEKAVRNFKIVKGSKDNFENRVKLPNQNSSRNKKERL